MSVPLRYFVYLGHADAAAGSEPPASLRHEDAILEGGERLALERCRSPWNPGRDQERVIVGSHPARGDVLLRGDGIEPEHVRLYIPRDPGGATDLRAIVPGTTWVNQIAVGPHDWTPLRGGETIRIARWEFRFEGVEADAAPAS